MQLRGDRTLRLLAGNRSGVSRSVEIESKSSLSYHQAVEQQLCFVVVNCSV